MSSILPGLSVAAQYSYQNNDIVARNFYSRKHKVLGGATAASLGPGRAEQFYSDFESELFESTIHYAGDVAPDVGLELIAGYSYNDFVNEGFNVGGGDFVADKVSYNNFSFAQDFNQGEGNVGSYRNTNRLIGFFSRANVNYDGTFFFNGSIRREGSSRFGIDNKWGLFWSAGIGVELANLVELPLSELRLRASIGKTGQDAPTSGISLSRLGPTGSFFVSGRYIQSFSPVSNANPNLKWEEKTEINIGLDFVALDNRLSGRIDAYQSTTSDLLFQISVPVPPNLFSTTYSNVGELSQSGLELSLDYEIIQPTATGGFSWDSGLIASLYSETMLDRYLSEEARYLAEPGSPGMNGVQMVRIKQGEPIGQFWGPRFSRIGDNGKWLFHAADGSEKEYEALDIRGDDGNVLGSGLPDFQIGWTNSMTFGNFDASFFLEGVFGHQIANLFNAFYSAPKQITSYNVLKSAFDLTELKDDPRWSSYYLENGDYVRLNNATVGYTLPRSVIGNTPLRRVRVYLSGNNLLTITSYGGLNPQVRYVDRNIGQSGGGQLVGPLGPGIERPLDFFTSRSITFGVNINL